METFQLGHPTPILPIFSPSCWHAEYFLCFVVYLVPYLTQGATHFQPCSHQCSTKKLLICSRYLVKQVLWICWCGGSLESCLVDLDMKSVTLHVSRKWHPNNCLSTLDHWPGCQSSRVQDFSQPKSVSLWKIPHHSLDPKLSATGPTPIQEWTLNTLHLNLTTVLPDDQMSDVAFHP